MKAPGFRYANEVAGALVLLAILIFVGAVLQAGVMRQWFNPPNKLTVNLPPDGLSGLSAGAEVEILGTRAGEVRRIIIRAEKENQAKWQAMQAEVALDPAMREFVRSDSKASIRKRFGVAGAAFLEISRGEGRPLDWTRASINAESERAPTETMGAIIDEVRTKIFPIIEDTQRAIHAVANMVEKINDPQGDVMRMVGELRSLVDRIERGEGAVGRLLNNDTLVRELEKTVIEANKRIVEAQGVVAEIEKVSREAAGAAREANNVMRSVSRQSERLPTIMQNAEKTLASVQSVAADLAKATPQLPVIARNVEASTAGIPTLLAQTQQTTLELERLLKQLQSHWLLGGAGGGGRDAPRQPPLQVRP
jgi:phospholipid/cholesterol/gamma-HCH transport system substrate-binding protein